MKELKRIQKSFPDFCQCRRRHEVNKEMYDRLSDERKQEEVAEAVAKQLQERVKTDKCCQELLGTYIPALAKIDITTMVDDTPALPSQHFHHSYIYSYS